MSLSAALTNEAYQQLRPGVKLSCTSRSPGERDVHNLQANAA